jgi:biopolymer transport protein TolR
MAFIRSYNSKHKKAKAVILNEINITPLVDVMLVLLVVFMVTAPLMIAGVNIDLPQTDANPIKSQEEPLSITIDRLGNIYIQNNKVEIKDLKVKLMAITKENKNSKIFIRGDNKIDYGIVMQVMGIINEAGYEKVALISEIITK